MRYFEFPFIPLYVLIVATRKYVFSLECVQCDRQGVWYSPSENDLYIESCQRGLIPATKCSNLTHTHCIYSFYKHGGATTITERKCGIADDITHCTLYTMNPKFGRHRNMKRHLLTGNPSITTTGVSRRRESFVVEVCTLGCNTDGCLNFAPQKIMRSKLIYLILSFSLLISLNYTPFLFFIGK